MGIIGFLLLIVSLVLFCLSIFFFFKSKTNKVDLQDKQKKYNEINFKCKELQKHFTFWSNKLDGIKDQYNDQQKDLEVLISLIDEKDKTFKQLNQQIDQAKIKANNIYSQQKQIIEERLKEFEQITKKAKEQYVQNIEKAYERADAAYAQKIASLKAEQDAAAAALNTLKETQKAARQALLKQQEIKLQRESYCLIPSSLELKDIHKLESIKKELNKPRVLAMLVWQSYWQPLAKKQFPIILQGKTKTGIYRITNLQTDQCYIGQSLDIYKRFCQHCKAGLGIDTPVGNKLYKAIQEYGLQNFSFELLCQCSKQELNQKERYFIGLYQADTFGYNSTIGNK